MVLQSKPRKAFLNCAAIAHVYLKPLQQTEREILEFIQTTVIFFCMHFRHIYILIGFIP